MNKYFQIFHQFLETGSYDNFAELCDMALAFFIYHSYFHIVARLILWALCFIGWKTKSMKLTEERYLSNSRGMSGEVFSG